MSIEENKAIMRRFIEELWNAGNLDVADEIIHPNRRVLPNQRDPHRTPKVTGPEGDKERVQRYYKTYPDLRRTIVDMVAEGDKVVLYSTFNYTHTEEDSDGFAPTGEALELTGANCWTIEEGKILEAPWSCFDLSPVRQQIARAAIRLFVENVWNEGDLDAADQYIAPDYVRHDPTAPEDVQGIDGFKEMVALYRTAFPDLHLHIEDIIAGGDKGKTVAVRWSSTGTHQGELMGVAPTGKPVNSSGNTFLRLENGKIAQEWVQWDNVGLLQQIGAIPADWQG